MKTRLKRTVKFGVRTLRLLGKPKIFCVGRNKTGTTSLAKALSDLGIVVADQRRGEMLLRDWAKRDFRRIVQFCNTAQAFQDVPFSLPYTFQILDIKFPSSKFILTVRDSPEQWYSSLTRFHAKLFGVGRVPNYKDLKSAIYCYPGFMLEANRLIYPTPDDDLYNKEILINHYKSHNESVVQYFRHRPNDLLVINLAEKGAYAKFCKFIGKPSTRQDFARLNKTEDIQVRYRQSLKPSC